MTPEQFVSRAGKYAGLVERFLIGRPVEIVLCLSPDDIANTSFREGKLHIALVYGKGSMLAHEMGHIVEATPDELFMPNLGLGLDGGTSATPEQRTAESRVLAWHIVLNGGETRDRLSKFGEAFFGARSSLGRVAWRKALDENIETFTVEQFAERWEKAWEVIDARAAVTV